MSELLRAIIESLNLLREHYLINGELDKAEAILSAIAIVEDYSL